MKLTRHHKLWIVILAILAGIALFLLRAKPVGPPEGIDFNTRAKVRVFLV